ncbi:hypothetical protein CNQ84_13650 [Pseudomonas abyssi]|uniref:General secretion pathway protein GspM n=1 Tax=Pseudomonas abyssi TaxID=170540 RepID=A0A2A3MFV7_9PSED|nr:type II secretion system protein GspM [Pseudomonas abyssi]PBK03617.1 hypothetical protein CNQ84_13650 [Pseudomonas abyssi]
MKIPLTALQPAIANAKGRWQALSAKERKQILIMLVVVGAAVIWLTLVKPALDTLAHWEDELPRLRTQANTLQLVLADVGSPVIADSASQTPSQQLQASLDHAGFTGIYLINQREDKVQVDFQQPVDATQLMAWLFTISASPVMTVQQLSMQRSDQDESHGLSGQVRAQVIMAMEQAGSGL